MNEIQSEGTKALDQAEHNIDANAKRVVIRYQNLDDGEWYNWDPTDSPTLQTRLDDSNDPILYSGKASIGSATSAAVWQIARLDTTSGVIKTWAGGGTFTEVWDDRAGLSYS